MKYNDIDTNEKIVTFQYSARLAWGPLFNFDLKKKWIFFRYVDQWRIWKCCEWSNEVDVEEIGHVKNCSCKGIFKCHISAICPLDYASPDWH